MRIVFAGTPEVAIPSLRAIIAAGHEVVAVVTRPDAPTGRGKKLTASPVALVAEELGLRVLKPVKADAAFAEELAALQPDVCPVVAYGALLPQPVLDVPKHGWVNLHFSLLPDWRGAAPVQRAIMAGQDQTGASTFRLVKELDAGPVWRQSSYQIAPTQTAGDVLTALANDGAQLLVETLADIEAGVDPVAQPDAESRYAAKINPDEVQINWHDDAAGLSALIRGASPDPGAWTQWQGQRFRVLLAVPADVEMALAPGELSVDKKHVWAGTGTGALELLTVQAAGKKPMRAPDWARGIQPGTELRLG